MLVARNASSLALRSFPDVGVKFGVLPEADAWAYSAYLETFWARLAGKLADDGTGEGVYDRRSANDFAALKFCAGVNPLNPGEPGISKSPEACRPSVWEW